jgi:hypothetical protein
MLDQESEKKYGWMFQEQLPIVHQFCLLQKSHVSGHISE